MLQDLNGPALRGNNNNNISYLIIIMAQVLLFHKDLHFFKGSALKKKTRLKDATKAREGKM